MKPPLAVFWAKNISFSIILFSSGPKEKESMQQYYGILPKTKQKLTWILRISKNFTQKKITSTIEKNYKSNSLDYLCAFTPTTLNGWFLFLVWYFVRSFVLLLSFVKTLVCEKAREKKRKERKRTRKVKWLHCTKTAFKLNFQREKDSCHCIWIQSDCWENDFSHSAKFYIKFDRRI